MLQAPPCDNENVAVYPFNLSLWCFYILHRRLKSWVVSRIDRHAASQHHVRMEILSPTLEKGGQGGFEKFGKR